MKRCRNIELFEEGRTPEYKAKLKAEAKERAERWTNKRHEFSMNHPYLIIIISAVVLSSPLILTVLIYSRMAK